MRYYFDEERLNSTLPYIKSAFPRTKTELDYETSFQFLVAVILSAQTTDKQVNKTTPSFFKLVKEPKDLLSWTLPEIESHLSSVNYYKNKCKFILESAKLLEAKFGWVIPNTLEDILTLPGVGIKTAKVVLSVLYDAPYVWVDTHVHRVLNRIGIVRTKLPEETDKVVEKKMTIAQKQDAHHALVLFGRYKCTARNPQCASCSIQSKCLYFMKNGSK